ncbi:hypothetical protein PT287_09670 [Lactobacillus sp. ESL0679]|uniref:hypothetical protein n=1 Tax=Lactobacillus sp. ESL0679 TaxID=2983209 RepID=UPI0023F97F95|nr:hypothetical protein [Lactobacillus sp. ESL0679]MDF7683765.1 hypothetical protein [Lactobacillus sp. ESL0679]
MFKKVIVKDGKYLSSTPNNGVKFIDISELKLQASVKKHTVHVCSQPTIFKLTKHKFKQLVKNDEFYSEEDVAEIKQVGIDAYWKKYSKRFKNVVETVDCVTCIDLGVVAEVKSC